jgi:hypothetical protein
MHSDWFKGIDILQGRWQHGEKVGYCYPSGLEKTLCKWEVYVPLVTKGLKYTKYIEHLHTRFELPCKSKRLECYLPQCGVGGAVAGGGNGEGL